jgi:IS30 family transposase
MSAKQKEKVWQRWREGDSFSEIGRSVGRPPGSIYCFLERFGGIVPQARTRAKRSLALYEREEISRGIAAGLSIRQIAQRLKRSPLTICREIKRHGGRRKYRAIKSDEKAWENARRFKFCKLAQNHLLCKLVSQKIALEWSPEQLSGWLKRTYPGDVSMQISHETIYRSLFVQARGFLKKEMMKPLRTGRKMRQSKKFNTKGVLRGRIVEGSSIHERPSEIEERLIPGHWEGGLIAGTHNSHIATLVERHSRYTLLVKIEGKDAPQCLISTESYAV